MLNIVPTKGIPARLRHAGGEPSLCLAHEVVPTKGIEPSLSCENQILSLARLPIPPHGPLFEMGCNNTPLI